MTQKDLVLAVASSLIALLLAVGFIRWLAPGLLGGARDLELVQADEKVPPFFEGVFRPEHFRTTEFLLKDPRTLNRPRPFHGEIPPLALGPHDILGFRNRSVPAVADVIVIGDSQTYGINVQLEDSWPGWMTRGLHGASVYSMAIGGWGAVQYADMFVNAAAFRPHVIVVAFYTGNDPLDSFSLAYGSDLWRELRPDPNLQASAAPSLPFPPPESQWWTARFERGEMSFTPTLRLSMNMPHPAVDAGYGVMRKAAEAMASLALKQNQRVLFTIIPTKELVYAKRVEQENLQAPQDYHDLLQHEQNRIATLSEFLRTLPNASYVDVVTPLQDAARRTLDLYPRDINGHPLTPGYRVIGDTIAAAVAPLLPPAPQGWVTVAADSEGNSAGFFLIRDGTAWLFTSRHLLEENGWKDVKARFVTSRDLAGIPKRQVTEVDPLRFGPRR